MNIWENFEIECTDYLNKRFGTYARFIRKGGSNSTVPDILVRSNSGSEFYIEAKHCPAQCGQFVLLPNIEACTFEYSCQNANRMNSYVEKIIHHMDTQFDEYKEVGTAGKNICMNNGSSIFSNWIIQTYIEKGTKYFITNDFTILPIERFEEFFDVTAKYRIKRSGSKPVGKAKFSPVLDYINSHNYLVTGSRIDGDKLYVASNVNLHNKRFIPQKDEYMFSQREDDYEIRKLSNTYHANVIFSIKQKANTKGLSDDDFISLLK